MPFAALRESDGTQQPYLLASRAPQRYSPLAIWHLLSLDAPSVTAVWTVFIAYCSHVAIPWSETSAVFLAVWIIYAADRLLDSHPVVALHTNYLEERHHFHRYYRRAFLACIVAASIALAFLLRFVNRRDLLLYALLGALLSAWLLLIHIQPLLRVDLRLPKELAVGVFFAAAVCVPTVARAPNWELALLPCSFLVYVVSALNCFCIYAWENPGAHQPSHWTTRWSISHIPQIVMAIVGLAMLVVWLSSRRLMRFSGLDLITPAIASALSALLLLALHKFRQQLTAIHLRACADLALLTPLLLLPGLRLASR